MKFDPITNVYSFPSNEQMGKMKVLEMNNINSPKNQKPTEKEIALESIGSNFFNFTLKDLTLK